MASKRQRWLQGQVVPSAAKLAAATALLSVQGEAEVPAITDIRATEKLVAAATTAATAIFPPAPQNKKQMARKGQGWLHLTQFGCILILSKSHFAEKASHY